jgi:hypothetical protein
MGVPGVRPDLGIISLKRSGRKEVDSPPRTPRTPGRGELDVGHVPQNVSYLAA